MHVHDFKFSVIQWIAAWQPQIQHFHLSKQHWRILSIFRWRWSSCLISSSHCRPSLSLHLRRNQEPLRFLRSDAPYPPKVNQSKSEKYQAICRIVVSRSYMYPYVINNWHWFRNSNSPNSSPRRWADSPKSSTLWNPCLVMLTTQPLPTCGQSAWCSSKWWSVSLCSNMWTTKHMLLPAMGICTASWCARVCAGYLDQSQWRFCWLYLILIPPLERLHLKQHDIAGSRAPFDESCPAYIRTNDIHINVLFLGSCLVLFIYRQTGSF